MDRRVVVTIACVGLLFWLPLAVANDYIALDSRPFSQAPGLSFVVGPLIGIAVSFGAIIRTFVSSRNTFGLTIAITSLSAAAGALFAILEMASRAG